MVNTQLRTSGLIGVAVSFCWLVLLGAGCQQASGPALATVSGTVTLDSKPLAGATVHYQPESGRPSFGVTNEQGEYTMGYSLERSGVTLGTHTVRIRTVQENDHGQVVRKELLPKKYHDQTTLTAVVEDKPNVINFELESK